jgi:hypothetical protein
MEVFALYGLPIVVLFFIILVVRFGLWERVPRSSA